MSKYLTSKMHTKMKFQMPKLQGRGLVCKHILVFLGIVANMKSMEVIMMMWSSSYSQLIFKFWR
jgi:hypothetical protein